MLAFESEEPLSLISEGRGFWRYVETDSGLRFLTEYNYETRWGQLGQMVDRLVFRPLLGWMTAFSFDVLARWVENGTTPEISFRTILAHAIARAGLALIWVYQGLVPKLLVSTLQSGSRSVGSAWKHSRVRRSSFSACSKSLLGLHCSCGGDRHGWPTLRAYCQSDSQRGQCFRIRHSHSARTIRLSRRSGWSRSVLLLAVSLARFRQPRTARGSHQNNKDEKRFRAYAWLGVLGTAPSDSQAVRAD